jgi:nitrogen-specific signal transduction histidine kinase
MAVAHVAVRAKSIASPIESVTERRTVFAFLVPLARCCQVAKPTEGSARLLATARPLVALRRSFSSSPAKRRLSSGRDTGSGIASDVLERLYEPFFSTKRQGAGLGLGLTISLGIVQEFGGSIMTVAIAPGAESIGTLKAT